MVVNKAGREVATKLNVWFFDGGLFEGVFEVATPKASVSRAGREAVREAAKDVSSKDVSREEKPAAKL